jgi:hypothetical protein
MNRKANKLIYRGANLLMMWSKTFNSKPYKRKDERRHLPEQNSIDGVVFT